MTKISISSLNLEDGCERAQIIYKRKKKQDKNLFSFVNEEDIME